MLDFRIATFLKLCETRSYTRTARLLEITQPSVTQHIKYLQNKYHCQLFTFEGKTLHLTPEGEYLRHQAETMTTMSARVVTELERMSEQHKALHFGVPKEIGEIVVSSIVTQMLSGQDAVNICMTSSNTAELLHLLEVGKLDFVLADKSFLPVQMLTVPLGKVRFECYGGQVTSVNPKTLTDHCLLLREEGASDRALLKQMLLKKGLVFSDFSDVITSNMPVSLHTMASSDMGVIFTYATNMKSGNLHLLHLSEFSEERSLVFVYRRDSADVKNYKMFFETFKMLWKEQTAEYFLS